MTYRDDLQDIGTAPSLQLMSQETKRPRAISQDVHAQHEASRSSEYAATSTKVAPGHLSSTLLSNIVPTSINRRYSWWQSIGPVSASILIVATLVILISFFILLVLWCGAEDAINRKTPSFPSFWRMIVLRQWTTRVITICSAAIRTSISLQIGVLVSALAAIVLETSGARMMDIPLLSIERIQSNPFGILPAVLRQTLNGLAGALHSFIIVTSVIILLVSNLNSTVLLSDLGPARIAGQPTINDSFISYTTYADQLDTTVVSWKSKPAAQWRFAEARIGPNRYGDTGRVYRAFLPFPNVTTRTSLEYYSGPAVVANTRTVCVPLPQDNFTIETKRRGDFIENGPTLWLRQKLQYSTRECAVIPADEGRGWPTTLCAGETLDFENQFIDELESDKTMRLENEEIRMRKIVILNTTADIESLYENNTILQPRTPKRLQRLSLKEDGPWTRIYDSTGLEIIAATSCYYNIRKAGIYNVTMTGDAIREEPQWDPNTNHTTTHGDDWEGFWKDKTKEILYQFGVGVDANDTAKRGILKLNIASRANTTDQISITGPLFEEPLLTVLDEMSLESNTTWKMGYGVPWQAHESHTLVFQNILQETGDPALAVQSVLTRLHQATYYSLMDGYDLAYPVTTIHVTETIVPVQWLGLALVISMAALHLVQVFVIMTIFLMRTRLSALGNAWLAVAQATHVTNALESAENDLDKEIEERAEATGHDKNIYVLSRCEQEGKMEVRHIRGRG